MCMCFYLLQYFLFSVVPLILLSMCNAHFYVAAMLSHTLFTVCVFFSILYTPAILLQSLFYGCRNAIVVIHNI